MKKTPFKLYLEDNKIPHEDYHGVIHLDKNLMDIDAMGGMIYGYNLDGNTCVIWLHLQKL